MHHVRSHISLLGMFRHQQQECCRGRLEAGDRRSMSRLAAPSVRPQTHCTSPCRWWSRPRAELCRRRAGNAQNLVRRLARPLACARVARSLDLPAQHSLGSCWWSLTSSWRPTRAPGTGLRHPCRRHSVQQPCQQPPLPQKICALPPHQSSKTPLELARRQQTNDDANEQKEAIAVHSD